MYLSVYFAEDTDSSSGKMKARTMERSGPPKIHYSTGSVYRSSYRPPQGTLDFDRSLPTTSCGSTHNRLPAIGVGMLTIHCTLHLQLETLFTLQFIIHIHTPLQAQLVLEWCYPIRPKCAPPTTNLSTHTSMFTYHTP